MAGFELPGFNASQKSATMPRKTGAYDTEGILAGQKIPSQLVYFQDSTKFGQPLVVINSKVYGRDTNITSRTGGMAKGERLYAYGITGKIDAMNQKIDATNIGVFEEWRQLWGIGDVEIKLGADEFIRCQARDIPVRLVGKNPQTTVPNAIVHDLSEDGLLMFDLTIAQDPYIFDEQEDFRINLNFAPQTLALSLETHITLRIEGIRVKLQNPAQR
jgi:hypothetical protein